MNDRADGGRTRAAATSQTGRAPEKEEMMRREKVVIFWSAGGLASAVLAATVWAQPPVLPTGPGRPVDCKPEGGRLHRAARHIGRVLQDNFVGYPQEFVEPPPGFLLSETFGTMKGKANVHRFMLYRSDFLAGSEKFSPSGAARFNLMATRLSGWVGPVVIEWSPDEPGLAESRKAAVASVLQGAGFPMAPERVVIGPSPYPGMLGVDAAQNYEVLITRDRLAPSSYSVSPTAGPGFGGGGPN